MSSESEPVKYHETDLPRHDFYQDSGHVILSLYMRGFGQSPLKERVTVNIGAHQVIIITPSVYDDGTGPAVYRTTFGPLAHAINPDQSSYRILNSKIELKLGKTSSLNWTSALTTSSTTAPPPPNANAGPSVPPIVLPSAPSAVPTANTGSNPKARKDWDKVVAGVDEDEESKDPNAGGDAQLKKFFSQIYSGADEDTKRAMIKSYTESGGTTLSTDWNSIGKEQTPIRPPDGMEAKKY